MQLKTKGHVEGNAPEAECSHLQQFLWLVRYIQFLGHCIKPYVFVYNCLKKSIHKLFVSHMFSQTLAKNCPSCCPFPSTRCRHKSVEVEQTQAWQPNSLHEGSSWGQGGGRGDKNTLHKEIECRRLRHLSGLEVSTFAFITANNVGTATVHA